MRILLLTHYYAPEVGPPQLRWDALTREFRRRGHDVHVVAPPPHYPSGQLLDGQPADQVRRGAVHAGAHGETVHRVAWRPATVSSALSTLVDQLVTAGDSALTAWRRRRRIAPDVVVATVPALPTMAAGWAVSRLLRRPLVVEMRDAWPDLAVDARNPGRSWKQQVRWYAVAAAARGVGFVQRRADLVVTTTDAFTDVLRRRGLRRVATVRNAHHPVPGLAELPPRRRTPDEPLRIVYVGTVGRAQDLETAVRALARARAAGVDATMRVVGTGARTASLAGLVADLGVPVELVGPQPRERIEEHYRWADTLLVSLRPWRGLCWAVPSKLYEALAVGLHVSAMAAGETRDIIEETGAGFAVPPGDERALAEAWTELARQGPSHDRAATRAWAEEHASETGTATAYLELLEDVSVGGPKGARV